MLPDPCEMRTTNDRRMLVLDHYLPSHYLACDQHVDWWQFYLFICPRDVGSITLLENSCCLVALRVWDRGIHRLLKDNPFLRMMFGCMSVVLILLYASPSMALSFLITTNVKVFSGNSFLITISTKIDVPVDVTMNVAVFRDVML